MSITLAIDIGTRTGWALRRNGRIISGKADFHLKKDDGEGMRYLKFKRWLTEMRNTHGDIDLVFYERVHNHAGVEAAHVYGGLVAILLSWCEHHDTPYIGIGVGTIKKHFAGTGRASKAQMMQAAFTKGFRPETADEADALGVLLTGEHLGKTA